VNLIIGSYADGPTCKLQVQQSHLDFDSYHHQYYMVDLNGSRECFIMSLMKYLQTFPVTNCMLIKQVRSYDTISTSLSETSNVTEEYKSSNTTAAHSLR